MACLALALGATGARSDSAPPDDLPGFIPPVLATPCGQGAGATRVAEICDRLGIICWVGPQLRMGDLGATCCVDAGCPFGGVLIVTVGVDEEAMRAQGVDIAFEAARCRALVERARELGMAVVVALIGEASQAVTEEEAKLLRTLATAADLLIACGVTSGRATLDRLSSEFKIPWMELDGLQDLGALLAQLFGVTT